MQYRNTRQRKIVLEAVQEHHDHPSADQIYLEIRAKDPRISRGTVYRNLNVLSEEGQITHVRFRERIGMIAGQTFTIT